VKTVRPAGAVARFSLFPFTPDRPMRQPGKEGRSHPMLWTIFVILLVLWLLGLVSGYTLSGFIHILLVIAVVILLIRVIQGRPAV
jgi:hypothetical protein